MTIPRMNSKIGKTNILCVDDSQNMLLLCRAVLELNGYRVWTEPSGSRALEALEHHRIDAAIIDNEMPGMNGVQLAKAIKQNHPRLPVLMFSGSSPKDLGGVDCFLHKADGPRALVNALHSLGLQTARRQLSQAASANLD
jgi:CheY-like chemotaxis protein